MSSTITEAKLLDAQVLEALAMRSGPCITITIPHHHPGAQEGSRLTIFQNLLKKSEERLAASKITPSRARDLLAPLWDMSQDRTLEHGGLGWAIFAGFDFAECYRTNVRFENVVIASHLDLSPYVAILSTPADVFVLGLSTKHLRLLKYSHGECRDIELPPTVPKSLEAAGQFDRSERHLENRSTAGISVGNLSRVRFGTTTDRDTPDAYLHDFFRIVDHKLIPFLTGRPLVLMGVPEEIAAYRRAAEHRNILIDGTSGNVEFLPAAEIGMRTQQTLSTESFARGASVLAEIREMRDRSRVLTDVQAALHAASQGRVHQLCVRDATRWMGSMETALDRTGLAEEDLLNATVVETLRTHGNTFVVEQDHLLANEPVVAALRY